MRRYLRYAGLGIVVGAVLFWAARGANRGWTKTTVPVRVVDEVTGLEGVEYHDRLVPGIDFLSAALALGVLLGGTSFLFPQRPSNPSRR